MASFEPDEIDFEDQYDKADPIQVIPGNLQRYVSTNRSLPQCKTLPAHFSNNMMAYCLLNVI